jgi:hypothetical protein
LPERSAAVACDWPSVEPVKISDAKIARKIEIALAGTRGIIGGIVLSFKI